MIRVLAPRSSVFDLPQLVTVTRTRFANAIDVNRVDDPQQGPCVAVYLVADPAPATVTAWRSDITAYTVTHPTADEQAVTESVNADTLRTKAAQALASNATYLALANPSVAQNTAQTKAMTRQVNGIIRLLLGKLDTITDS